MASVAEMRMNSGVKGGNVGGVDSADFSTWGYEGGKQLQSGDDGKLERNKEAEESSFARK